MKQVKALGTFGFCCVFVAIPGLRGDEPSKHPASIKRQAAKTRQMSNNQRTRSILKMLDQVIEKMEFDQLPLEDVLEWFRQQGLNNITVHWKTMEALGDGPHRQTPITLTLECVTLGELLTAVLEQASQEVILADDELTYHVFDGLLKVSTRGDFDRQTYTRSYYIEDLLISKVENELMPFIAIGGQVAYVESIEPVVAPGSVGLRPNVRVLNTGVTFGPGNPDEGGFDFKSAREQKLQELIAVLKTVRPLTWRDNGGRGDIQAYGDKLVITQTIEMHEIIGGAFAPENRQ